jgi:hypothetical protein
MDPTKNNKGAKQHNTIQKTNYIGSMDPTKTTRGDTTQHNAENYEDRQHGPHQKQQGETKHNTMQKTKKIGSMDPTKIAVLISISPNNFHFTYYEEE